MSFDCTLPCIGLVSCSILDFASNFLFLSSGISFAIVERAFTFTDDEEFSCVSLLLVVLHSVVKESLLLDVVDITVLSVCLKFWPLQVLCSVSQLAESYFLLTLVLLYNF